MIYPNPVHDDEILEYFLKRDEVITLDLHDINGKLVKQFINEEFRSKGICRESLNFINIRPGNYILTISNKQGKTSVKVIKE